MKKLLLIFFLAFTVSHVNSAPLRLVNEDKLSSLLDSFSVALVKKDKVWMQANLNDGCKMYDPTGSTLNKSSIIMAFTEGIYSISKSEALNRSIKINGTQADVSADLKVEGFGNINGSEMDITGTYRFNLKFVLVESNWQISEITINQ
jgi:hypothetical protein